MLPFLSTALAFAITLPLVARFTRAPVFMFLLIAVILSAWYGGLRVGLLAVVLSTLGAAYLVMEPVGSLLTSRAAAISLAVFVFGAVAMCWFIAELHDARDRLRRSEGEYRRLVDNATYGIFRSSLRGDCFLSVNPALVKMLNYDSTEELQSRRISRDIFRVPEERAEVLRQLAEKGEVRGIETQWRRKDGSFIHVRLSGRAERDGRGEAVFGDGIVEDVSEPRLLEEQLRLAQRLESVGRLAGGIAHDFNNALMVITGYVGLLHDKLGEDDDRRRYTTEVLRASERAASLVSRLLAFSRKQVLTPRILDLNAVLTDIAKILPRIIGEDVQLSFQMQPGLGRVLVDPAQIEQVIMNLAVNARDAMPRGGKLTLETADVYLDEHYTRTHVGTRPGWHVMLAMSDSGEGMPPEVRAHIFEPFFTTKEQGKGTGLGLAQVYGIVKQSNGSIWVYSEPGRGTTFKIYLPRVETPRADPDGGLAPARSAGGSETILVVEDEAALRAVVCEYLEGRGYRVLAAGNAEDALVLAGQHAGDIRLLITDVIMPGKSGSQLAAEMGKQRPGMRVLYISGYTDDAIVNHGVLEAGTEFLQKPFPLDLLGSKVRHILDAPPSASS
jgi:PAS domain S-box-containing protein